MTAVAHGQAAARPSHDPAIGVPAPSGVDGPVAGAAAPPADATGGLDQPAEIAAVVINLVRLYTGIKAKVTTGPEGDLSPLFLLVKLVHQGPRRASDLAEQMCADPSTVSRQVASLVRSGLVERRADPHDGRASILVPTELGLRTVDEHARRRGATVRPVIDDWPQQDRDDFLRLMRQYVAGVEEHREEIIAVLTASSAGSVTPATGTARPPADRPSTAPGSAARTDLGAAAPIGSPGAATTKSETEPAGMQDADPARGSSTTTTKGL